MTTTYCSSCHQFSSLGHICSLYQQRAKSFCWRHMPIRCSGGGNSAEDRGRENHASPYSAHQLRRRVPRQRGRRHHPVNREVQQYWIHRLPVQCPAHQRRSHEGKVRLRSFSDRKQFRQRLNLSLPLKKPLGCSCCRHCLWILGNAATLRGSGSIWEELVEDATDRRCLFNWEDGAGVSSLIPLRSAGLIGGGHGWNAAASGSNSRMLPPATSCGYEADICGELGSLRIAE